MKHLRLPIGDRERGWISYLTIDSNPKLQFSVCLSYYFLSAEGARNSKPLASNTFRYLEADVRRNGRNEARREVTLPWFQEEGSQPSQLGGYRIILFWSPFSRFLCNQTLAKISSGPAKFTGPRTREHKRQPLCSQFFASFQPAFIVPQLSI